MTSGKPQFCGYSPTVGRECATLQATDQHRLPALMVKFADTRGGQQYRILFTSSEGREYWVTMTAVGPFHDAPPLVVSEQGEFVFADDKFYMDLHGLAAVHGCILGDMVSVDTIH